MKQLLLTAISILLTASCNHTVRSGNTTTIHWDTWGVPHIFTDQDESFFFSDGWAQMHSHANTILRLYGHSRGRAAEYWGEPYLQNDVMVHTLGHPEHANLMWEQQDPALKAFISAFAAGMNSYANAHPEAIEEANRSVLPITPLDINLHSQFVVNTRFIAGRELQISQRWGENGSNAMAIAPSRSASGLAMLVQNPHLPWSNEFLFYEKHLVSDKRNIYGASLVGFPGFQIAFNSHLGWTHTNNVIDSSDLYELVLESDGYLYDGLVKAFETREVSLKIKESNGAFSEQEIEMRNSVHGPVVKTQSGKALALRLVGKDSHDPLLQWWEMANAESFEQFESALKKEQIPFWNVVYADQSGNIFYLFNGHVPIRDHGDWAYWQSLVPGDSSANLWTGIHPYESLPKVLNPDSGWVQNANDPPWTSTLPQVLDADKFPPYMSSRGMSFRPQRAAAMLMADESIEFDELIKYKHDTQLEMATRILDDLYAAIDTYGSDSAHEAKSILQQWDGKAETDSRGTVLFYNWAMSINPNNPDNYTTPWNAQSPLSTPDGLSDPEGAVQVLENVVSRMKEQYGRLDIAWGDVNRIEYNGISLPANGAASAVGAFRVAAAGRPKNGVQTVFHGDSWVAVIEFGKTPRAKVLLSYGNSTQEHSPHFGDQLKLFSDKQLRDAWVNMEQLKNHIERSEQLQSGTFAPAFD